MVEKLIPVCYDSVMAIEVRPKDTDKQVLSPIEAVSLDDFIHNLNLPNINPTEIIPGTVFLGKITPEVVASVRNVDSKLMFTAGQKLISHSKRLLDVAVKSHNESGRDEITIEELNNFITAYGVGISFLLTTQDDHDLGIKAIKAIEKGVVEMGKIHQMRENLSRKGFLLATNEMVVKQAVRLRLSEFSLTKDQITFLFNTGKESPDNYIKDVTFEEATALVGLIDRQAIYLVTHLIEKALANELSAFGDNVVEPVTQTAEELPSDSFYWGPKTRQWLMNWWVGATDKFETVDGVKHVWNILHRALIDQYNNAGIARTFIPTMFKGLLEILPAIELTKLQKEVALDELTSRINGEPYWYSGEYKAKVSGFWGGGRSQIEQGRPFFYWSRFLPKDEIIRLAESFQSKGKFK